MSRLPSRLLQKLLEPGADELAEGDRMRGGALAFGARLGRPDTPLDHFGEAIIQAEADVFGNARPGTSSSFLPVV